MKRAFIQKNISRDRLALLEKVNEIIEDYSAQGYRLTLRQLYYQLVTKNIVENTERSYKNVGQLVSDGRLIGLVDWEAIEDRVRVPRMHAEFDDLRDLVDAAISSYRLPRWAGQDYYVELWVEKDALAGVLEPIARDLHIVLMVNRGYSSQSAMFEAANRFKRQQREKECRLLYLGDHDPSGEDMVRDVSDRLAIFGAQVEVTKLALTMAQVEEHDPPPNPAKMSDSRAAKYVDQHGDSSWEVDALPPDVLTDIIQEAMGEFIDPRKMDRIKAKEAADKAALTKAAEKIVKERRR